MIDEDNTDQVRTVGEWQDAICFMLMELYTLTKDCEDEKFDLIVSVIEDQLNLVTSIAPDE